MFTEEENAFLARATLAMQIIVGSLASGVVMFSAVALFLATQQPKPAPDVPLLSYMSIAAAPAAILAALTIPGLIMRSQRQAIVAGRPTLKAGSIGGIPFAEAEQSLGPFMGGFQTALIVRSAILEGAAFFCLMAFMLEGQTASLVAAGVLLLIILSGMPTRSRVEETIQLQRRAVDELRQMEAIDAR
jgi:branched-subunit amino acid transport protein